MAAAPDPRLDVAMGHHSQGRLSDAESIYRKILKEDPDQPQAMHLLGLIAYQMGRSDIAVNMISKSVTIDPNNSEAHSNLGLVLIALGKLDDAALSFQKAVALAPTYAEAHGNLGLSYQNLGQLDEAIASYKKAIELRPNFAEAHNNLGNVLKELNRVDDAIACYAHAIAVEPNFAGAHCNLGNAYKISGDIEQASQSLNQALALEPDLPEAHHNLGLIFSIKEKLHDAIVSFEKAISLRPDFGEAHYDLGLAFKAQGKIDLAAKQLDIAFSYEPEKTGWLITKKLLLPAIPASTEAIERSRETFSSEVKSATTEGLRVEDPLTEIGGSTFYLAYHNLNNLSLMEDVAKMHLALCPKLGFEAAHCQSAQQEDKSILRIGFLSSFFRNHTIGKLNRGFIEHLSRDQFEVIVLRPPGKQDALSDLIDNAADKVVPLSGELDSDHRIIEKEKLDILFYPDIGMNPYSYYMAFARLAPVQAITWGHPESTGIPNMDYFISSEHIEDAQSANQYSEHLVKLNHLMTYFYRPELPEKTYSRADYNLPQEGRLYICPQSLFKFHPDFDGVLGEILRRDEAGYLVLIDDNKGGLWSAMLTERFKKSFPDCVDRVVFVPPMPTEKFFGLVNLADALLDIPTFSGGNSTLEAFALNKPIVTWPQGFMRASVTAGFYKQMGLSDLIASDEETYVTLALRLAQDEEFNQRMQKDIADNSHKIFENNEIIKEMENFFKAAYNAKKSGQTITF